MENLSTKLILIILIALLFGGYTWFVFEKGVAHEKFIWDMDVKAKEKAQSDKAAADQAATDAAALKSAIEKAKREEQIKDLEKRVENETSKNNLYLNCVMPVDGVRLLNEAIRGRRAH